MNSQRICVAWELGCTLWLEGENVVSFSQMSTKKPALRSGAGQEAAAGNIARSILTEKHRRCIAGCNILCDVRCSSCGALGCAHEVVSAWMKAWRKHLLELAKRKDEQSAAKLLRLQQQEVSIY